MSRSTSRGLALVVVLLGVLFVAAAPATAVSPPTISSFTPTSGPMRTSVKITGTNFVAPATVTFNGVSASAVTVSSPTSITAVVPATANTGPVKVTTSGGTATSTTSFTVTPGTYLSATAGPPGSTVPVYFSGFAAYEAVDVYFDNADLKLVSASVTGSGSVGIRVPAGATPGDHFVTAVGRKSGFSAQSVYAVRTNWLQYGFDASRSGENPTESILGAGNVKKLTRTWSSTVATNYANSGNQVVVANGVLYATNSSGITAVSTGTGAVMWSRNVGNVVTSPVVSGSTVVLGTIAGHYLGLNAATGATRYDVDYAEPFDLPLITVNGIAYAMAADFDAGTTTILAFNATTGAISYGGQLPSSCNAGSVAGNVLYTTCNNGHLYAVKTTGGGLLFDKDLTYYRSTGTAVVTDGLVITGGSTVNTGADVIIAVDATTGEYVWVQNTSLELTPGLPLAAADGTVVFRGEDQSGNYLVSALSTASGQPRWTVPGSTALGYPTTIANGLAYLPDYRYTRVLDLETGAAVAQLRGGQFAVVNDAGVYTANGSGTAVARYSLPASALPATRRPVAARLRPDRTLRAAA